MDFRNKPSKESLVRSVCYICVDEADQAMNPFDCEHVICVVCQQRLLKMKEIKENEFNNIK